MTAAGLQGGISKSCCRYGGIKQKEKKSLNGIKYLRYGKEPIAGRIIIPLQAHLISTSSAAQQRYGMTNECRRARQGDNARVIPTHDVNAPALPNTPDPGAGLGAH